jgi:hypothetical protein
MTSVAPGDSTVAFIRNKIRRLTVSSSESSLPTTLIDQYINNFYNQDFPYAIKIDQQRNVYTFFTEPNRDRYPLDINYNQGVRAPVYVEGILATLYKDRTQFFNLWPRWPTLFQPISGNGSTTSFSFTIQGPFLSKEVVLGGVDAAGNPISVNDDGNGNLLLQVPNPVTTVPVYNQNGIPPIPGMHNQNLGNPGLNYQGSQPLTSPFYTNAIGNVNYVTGQFNINFPVAPAAGQNMTLWVSQYQTGRPYCLLFWNNEFTIRPIPKLIHKVEVETYLTPVQFMLSTDNPIINQWAQYIAYGASREILRDRQDMEGVANLEEGFMRQEGLVLERQGIEEIGQPNFQLFNSTQAFSVYGGYGGEGYP